MCIKYENKFVVFLDVLGFKKMVLSKVDSDQFKIGLYLDTVKFFMEEVKSNIMSNNALKDIDFHYIIISDSVIISMNLDKPTHSAIEDFRRLFNELVIKDNNLYENDYLEDAPLKILKVLEQTNITIDKTKVKFNPITNKTHMEKELFKKIKTYADPEWELRMPMFKLLCTAIQQLQITLARDDIWLRGAITRGKTYVDKENNQIIGEAYIKAYELEQSHAIYPRVIIDTNIIDVLGLDSIEEFINQMNVDDNQTIFPLSNELTTNTNEILENVPFFINYFDIKDNKSMTQIYNNIQKNILNDISIYKKFSWLNKYMYAVNPDIN
ncbi:MAG: hypothetical protein LGB78_09435 [Sulfurovum sp.]|nr:hypothetical protein [Sulfurovum sp.]MCB4784509.1 hypothetical protein [Sulfurovum sp.]